MDTWLLLRIVESAGERNRVLYVLKTRGMAHSNQMREFVLSNDGHRAAGRLYRPRRRVHRLGAADPGGPGAGRGAGQRAGRPAAAAGSWSRKRLALEAQIAGDSIANIEGDRGRIPGRARARRRTAWRSPGRSRSNGQRPQGELTGRHRIGASSRGSVTRANEQGRDSMEKGEHMAKDHEHRRRGRPEADRRETWELRLYVAGQTPRSVAAFANLKQICEEHLQGKYHIEVIDLLKNPQLAKGDQILAIPTLVRKLPEPVQQDHRRSVQHGAGAGRAGPAAAIVEGR